MSEEEIIESSHSQTTTTTLSSKFDRFKYYNTLTGIVKSLFNKYTLIDLLNDSCVSGKIIFADGNMNVEMIDVVFTDPRGNEYVFENFFVHCRNIRHVHIPKKMDIKELMEQQLPIMGRRPKPAHTFKKVRAERRQREILTSVYGQNLSDKTE